MNSKDEVGNRPVDERPSAEAVVRPFAIGVEQVPAEGLGDVQSGNLTWRTLISADCMPSEEVILGVADFPPHGKLNAHRHRPAEFYFGLSGNGTVTADGVQLQIAKGVAIFIPPNAEHGVVAGAAGLSMVYGFARTAFADIEYEFAGGSTPAVGAQQATSGPSADTRRL